MGTPINVFVLVTMFGVSLYWMLKPTWIWARAGVILATSALLIFVFNPRALYLAIIVVLWGALLVRIADRFREQPWGRWLLWLILLPMVIDNIVPIHDVLPFPTRSEISPLITNATSLGLSFYSLKLYSSMNTAFRSKTGLELRSSFLTVLFYPSFAIGPIDEARAFRSEILGREFSGERFAKGVARLGTGIVKVFVLAPYVAEDLAERRVGRELDDLRWGRMDWFDALEVTYLSFVRLFFDFSGFTSIAVGVGLLFHIDISENFKAPFIAHSVQNFWQRWHLSLSRFITSHLFQPLVRATGQPRFAMVAAFVIIGLWHEVTLGYLIWGFGHGIALAWYFGRSRSGPRNRSVDYLSPRTWLGIFLTVTYVSFMSLIANQGSPSAIWDYLQALVRIG